jgi:uncharacterized protein
MRPAASGIQAILRTSHQHLRWFSSRALREGVADGGLTFDRRDYSPALRARLFIVQSTPFCNIDCEYCYLPDRDSTARMSLDTLALASRRLVEDDLLGPELSVVWHAGEPMVLPPEYYDEAIGVLKAELGGRCELRLSLQTNAMRVTDAWCDLIRRHRIAVGVSVDGPAPMHDRYRRTRRGQGTHGQVLQGMQRLREAGIGFHAIAVVHAQTLEDPDAFLDFFIEQGIHDLGCNFDEAEGAHASSSLQGHDLGHRAFLQRLLQRTTTAASPVQIRELTLARQQLLAPAPRLRWRDHEWPDNAQVTPFALVNLAHDGGFSTFSPELLGQPWAGGQRFVFGNVHDMGFMASSSGSMFTRIWSGILRGVQACAATCTHFEYCGGGSPANKHYELGDLAGTETLYCRAMVKRPFDAVLEHAERHLTGPAPVAEPVLTAGQDLDRSGEAP